MYSGIVTAVEDWSALQRNSSDDKVFLQAFRNVFARQISVLATLFSILMLKDILEKSWEDPVVLFSRRTRVLCGLRVCFRVIVFDSMKDANLLYARGVECSQMIYSLQIRYHETWYRGSQPPLPHG